MANAISGHTTRLADGNYILSPSLTNLYESAQGNGIMSLESTASTSGIRNTPASLSGAVSSDGNYTITIRGGYAILDGVVVKFANGYNSNAPASDFTFQLTSSNVSGTTDALASGEQTLFVIYVVNDSGSAKKSIRALQSTNTTSFPTTATAFLTDPDSSIDVEQSTVLAVVRATYQASGGGDLNVDIQNVYDTRTFIRRNPIYFSPLIKGAVGATLNNTTRVNEFADLDGLFSQTGDLAGSPLGALWMGNDVDGNDVLYFAGKQGTKKTFRIGPDRLMQITTNSAQSFEFDSYNYFLITPTAGIDLTASTADADFPPGHTVVVTNLAANTHSINFKNNAGSTIAAVGPQSWSIFTFGASDWVQVLTTSLSTSTSAGSQYQVQLGTNSAAFTADSGLTFNTASSPKLLTVTGDLSVSESINNPKNIVFTPVNDNPESTNAAYSLWIDDNDGDALKLGSTKVLMDGQGSNDLNALAAASVDVAADSIAFIDANDSNVSKKESIADLATAMGGTGLSGSSGTLNVDATQTGITAIGPTSGTLTVQDAMVVSGDLTIKGGTATLQAHSVTIDDKEIVLGSVTNGTFNGNFTQNSAVVTVTSADGTSGLVSGMTLTHGNLSGHTILSVDSASQITMSANYTNSTGAVTGVAFGAATDATANDGGITLLSDNTNKTIRWLNATDAWTFNQHIFPATDGAQNLGSSTARFGAGYLDALEVGPHTGTTITGNSAGLTIASGKNLTVDTNTLKVDGSSNKVGIVQATPLAPLQIETVGFGTAGHVASSTNTGQDIIIDLYNKTEFRSARVLIETHGEDGSSNDVVEVATLHITHDGSNIRATAFGITQSDSSQTNQYANSTGYSASLNGNNVALKLRPAVNGVNYNIKVHWQAMIA